MSEKDRDRGNMNRNHANNPKQNVNESVKNQETRESFKDSAATKRYTQEKDINKKKDKEKGKTLAEGEFESYSETGQVARLESPENGKRTETKYVNATGKINEIDDNSPHSHIQRLRKALKILQEEIGHLDKFATTVI